MADTNCGCYLDADAPRVIVYCPLHAAAPELLEALRALLPYLSTEAEMLDYASLNESRAAGFDTASISAREAIRKAEGK